MCFAGRYAFNLKVEPRNRTCLCCLMQGLYSDADGNVNIMMLHSRYFGILSYIKGKTTNIHPYLEYINNNVSSQSLNG